MIDRCDQGRALGCCLGGHKVGGEGADEDWSMRNGLGGEGGVAGG